MAWKELDVKRYGGPTVSPVEVLGLLRTATGLGRHRFRLSRRTGLALPTGELRDERFHVAMTLDGRRIDLSIWLYDDHAHVTTFHESLRERLTAEQPISSILDLWGPT